MASTYSALKIELIGTGEQSGTWGTTTNANLGTAIEEAIVGYATANFTSDADLTISLTDTNASQTARNLVLNVTSSGSLTATRNLIVPTIEKPYYIFNNTSGSQSIVVKTSAGTGVTVPNGRKALVYTDGTNVVPVMNSLPVSATLTYQLPLTDGTNGQLLQTNGSGVLSFVSGTSLATPLAVVGNSTAGAEIRLPEDTDNGSNYVALKAADSIASNLTFTLPATDGTNGQVIQTNGSGVLSFVSGTSLASPLAVTGNSTAGAEIRLPEDTDNGSNYVALKAANNIASNITFTLPSADGTNGQAITTNGSGTLGFSSVVSTSSSNTFTATQTFSGSSSAVAMVLNDAAEVATISATAATGTINYDVTTQSVLYYTSNASANWTVNFRGSSGTSLNTLMSTGQSVTVAFLVTQGATAYYNNVVQVDGSSVTPKYQGGTAWAAGNASAIDAYVYTIIKTGSAAFTVFASQTQFK